MVQVYCKEKERRFEPLNARVHTGMHAQSESLNTNQATSGARGKLEEPEGDKA